MWMNIYIIVSAWLCSCTTYLKFCCGSFCLTKSCNTESDYMYYHKLVFFSIQAMPCLLWWSMVSHEVLLNVEYRYCFLVAEHFSLHKLLKVEGHEKANSIQLGYTETLELLRQQGTMYIPKSERSQSRSQIYITAFPLLICLVERYSRARLQVVGESAVRCSVSSSSVL